MSLFFFMALRGGGNLRADICLTHRYTIHAGSDMVSKRLLKQFGRERIGMKERCELHSIE